MDIITFLSFTTFFYGGIYFIDHLLKSCMNVPYLLFLENLGVRIQPFQLSIFSTIFNRPVAKFAYKNKKVLKIWFSMGVITVIVLLFPCIVILISNIVMQLKVEPLKKPQQILQPVVPGVNLPVEEFPYYFLTLLVASVIHEAGHAIAAAEEDVHINGIGLMVLYALPGAYVDLARDGVQNLPRFKQLKILCAGVWHNIILAVVAFGIGITLPYTMRPFYDINKGILVLSLSKNSPALGAKGLFHNDVINSVNFCPSSNLEDWKKCLSKNDAYNQIGFCIHERIINYYDETIIHSFGYEDGSVECCNHLNGESKFCFELQKKDSPDVGETLMQPYSCLPVRVALEGSSSSCSTSSECKNNDEFCFAPSIKNSSRLLAISRRFSEQSKEKFVLFLGQPSELYFSVKFSDYIPKLRIFSPWFPYFVEVLMDYIVKFSGALGLLNLIPCMYLDGYWISRVIIDIFFSHHFNAFTRKIIHQLISILGTTLLIVTIALSIYNI